MQFIVYNNIKEKDAIFNSNMEHKLPKVKLSKKCQGQL